MVNFNYFFLLFLLIPRNVAGMSVPGGGNFKTRSSTTAQFNCPKNDRWVNLLKDLYYVENSDLFITEKKAYLLNSIKKAMEDLKTSFQCSIGIASAFKMLGGVFVQEGVGIIDLKGKRRAFQIALRLYHVGMNWITHAFVIKGKNEVRFIDDSDWPLTIYTMNTEQTAIQNEIKENSPEGSSFGSHPVRWEAIRKDFRDKNLKIGLLTLCDYPKDDVLPAYSKSNRRIYTEKHGYTMLDHDKRLDEDRPHAWAKILLLQKYIKERLDHQNDLDWIMWMDCDAYFMNLTTTIDHLLYKYASKVNPKGEHQLDENIDLIVQEDYAMLNTAVMIFRASQWSLDFLRENYGDENSPWIHHPWWEQASFSHQFLGSLIYRDDVMTEDHVKFMRTSPGRDFGDLYKIYPEKVIVIPQFEVNSYHPITSRISQHDNWEPGKFILSFNGCANGSSKRVMQMVFLMYYEKFCQTNSVEKFCIKRQRIPFLPWEQEE